MTKCRTPHPDGGREQETPTAFFPGKLRSTPHRPRAIVHLNIADFAVAVERLVDSRLQGRPVIVAPRGPARALVYDMSEEAFGAGVRKQMPLRAALCKCRDAVVVPPHPDRYERAMADVFRQVLPYSPRIEAGEADGHVFIDVTGTSRLLGPAADAARRMYRDIKKSVGFSPAWSIASSKLVAKVATRLAKPAGEYIVRRGEEPAFLSPLPLFLLPGVERDDLEKFRELNVRFVYQAAGLGPDPLAVVFGKRAGFLFDLVRGIDASPVAPATRKPERICAEHAFGDDTNDRQTIEAALYRLVETTGAGLRKQGRAAGILAIFLDYSDGVRQIRRMKVNPPSSNDFFLFQTARALLDLARTRRVRVRHLRLACEKPVFPPAQKDLFADPARQKQDRLMEAIDRIRDRFGWNGIYMGRPRPS